MFKMSENLAELIGIIIGDGNIYYNPNLRKYYFEITGDPKLEKEYFNYILILVYNILNKRPKVRVGGSGLRLRVYSKDFVEFLINIVKLPHGKIKGKTVKIPKCINNWGLLRCCIRGITDTDGSLFFSKKGNNLKYPSIEITTISKDLAFQIREILKNKYRIRLRKFSKENINDKYVVSVNGNIMVNKWIKGIGFSNERKLRKVSGINGI